MKDKLANLLEVRKLISLSITATFIVLAVLDRVDAKLIEYVVIAVISYYFAKSTALDTPKGN